jgi:hypothetical protein
MQYSAASGIAYYHIHKTGGVSFKEFLATALPDLKDVDNWPHYALADYFDILVRRGIDPGAIRILTTIRDPFEHVVSIYHYWRERGVPTGRDHVQAARDMDFGDFVRFYVACRDPDCRVYDELLLIDGVLPSNVRILRLESADRDADRVLNGEWGLGIRVSIPVGNTSNHGPAMDFYDADSVRLVSARYSWVFREGFYPDRGREPERGLNRLG